MSSPFLVYTSAGDNANIKQWLLGKNFDLWVTYYGNETGRYKELSDFYNENKGAKFPNLLNVHLKNPDFILNYKYVLVIDDDIEISGFKINTLFETAEKNDLWLCQPSFSAEGKISHKITRQNLFSKIRFTNFVEVTCPVIRSDKLISFFEIYDKKLIGYGIDWWMLNFIKPPKEKVAIFDFISCKNPLDSEKHNIREIDLLQSHENRKKIWEKIKKENNLSINERNYIIFSQKYDIKSISLVFLKLDQIYFRYLKKIRRYFIKKKN